MANLEFSIPYNDDPATLNEIFKSKNLNNNRIREVYLSGPQEYSGSGRITSMQGMDRFIETVKKIHHNGLRVNLVMNTTCEGSDWYSMKTVKKIMEYLAKAHGDYGVETVTLVNPILMKLIRKNFPDLEICASVLSEIDCVQRAILFKKAGADVVTPDMNINRNLKLLKEIKDITGLKIKPMVNEGCLYKCPFRRFHFNYVSHASKEVKDEPSIFFDNCVAVSAHDPSQVLKSCWIRPEDLQKYGEITSYFKIVGRSTPMNKVMRCIKAYMQESWEGGLLDIMCDSFAVFNSQYGVYLDNKSLDKYGFFEKVTSCNKECHKCNYCDELSRKLFEFRHYTKELKEEVY
jgi:collagenase-like PrtC family protease